MTTFDEVAAELYATRPDGFVAARNEAVRTAKEAGKRDLARRIAKLRRPTQSAWLVNTLCRAQRPLVDELLDLGNDIRDAMARGAGNDLQRLTRQRRVIEADLLKHARRIATEAGAAIGADNLREVEQTLAAGLAAPDVADEIRNGRLVRAVAPSGFGGGMPELAVVPGGHDDDAADDRSGDIAPAADQGGDVAAQRAAMGALDAATEELAVRRKQATHAGRELAEATADAEKLRAEEADLAERLENLRQRLHDAASRVEAATQDEATARGRYQEAEAAYAAAHAEAERWR